MILAAADYAEGKGTPPPPELRDWLRSKQFDSLPHAGGWKDQPYRYVNHGLIYFNVYSAIMQYKNALKDGKNFKHWLKENAEVMKTVNKIKDMRHATGNSLDN